MKILFCNIAYMNNYIGITEDDTPRKGGAFVTKNKDAHEQWNFLNDNGYCYGFVMNKGDQFAIERIDPDASHADKVENVTIVWCASNNQNKTVVVGWYENATVYREFQPSFATAFLGIERVFFAYAKAEDCYLLPDEARTYVIGRASKEGAGKGFGQQNYWYAESAYAQAELIPDVLSYLKAQKNLRINRIDADFEDNYANSAPLTEAEKQLANTHWDNGEYFKFLPLAYRLFHQENTLDSMYDIYKTLSYLNQYDMAIKWCHRIVEAEGETWTSLLPLLDLYQQIKEYKKSTEISTKLLSFEEAKNPDIKHELYSVIADNCFYEGNIETAVIWLDKILRESTDENLIQHTKFVKKSWESLR